MVYIQLSSHWQILRQLFTARSMHAIYFTYYEFGSIKIEIIFQ